MTGAPSAMRVLHGYELREPFRLGQAGEVWRGWQPAVRRPVLVRHVPPEVAGQPAFAGQFESEAATVARLEHPHILPLYDYWQDETGAYLVARYLPRTLRDALDTGPWPLEAVLRLAEQLALALDAAHAAGVVHQDLAPDLVLLDEQNNVFLAGFVLPQLRAGERAPDTPYTAPEQRTGQPVSQATDQYRLGMLVFEALSGSAPAQTGDALPSIRALRPELPSALNAVLQTATAHLPGRRYPDGRRFAAALRAAAVPSANAQPLIDPLTERERDILELIVQGRDNADIAEYLVLSGSTVKWYVKQIYSKLDAHSRDEAVERARALGLSGTKPEEHSAAATSPPADPPTSESRARALPTFGLPFIGRERALADLAALLSEPYHPLISLVAPGGMGKTRLAVEAARVAAPLYPDGVVFVSLAAATPAQMPEAILQALGILIAPEKPLWEQVVAYCASRRLLLLLDNFETVISAAPQVAELLAAAPHARALVTSRERLRLEGETVYTLGSMEAPPDGSGTPAMVESMELFIERARRVRYGFTVDDSSLRAMADICRLVDGMPLAIVLAASWAEVLLPSEIAAEIRASREFLAAEYSDLPERQRSVRIVFESAWERLSADERRTFARLSVFHGGFTRSAAAEVAGATLRTLAGLVTKALIWTDESGRYALHELLRQFAAEHLAAAGEAEALQEAHSRYYLSWATRIESEICGPNPAAALNAVDADWHNLRAALLWAAEHNNPEWITPTWKTLWLYYDRFPRIEGGMALTEEVAEQLQLLPATSGRDVAIGAQYLVCALLTGVSRVYRRHDVLLERAWPLLQHDADPTILATWYLCRGFYFPFLPTTSLLDYLQEAMDRFQAIGDEWGALYARIEWSWAGALGSDPAPVHALLRDATKLLAQTRDIGDPLLQARLLNGLGYAASVLGDWNASTAYYTQAAALARSGGDRRTEASAVNNAALVYINAGALDTAQTMLETVTKFRREVMPAAITGYEDLGEVFLRKGEFERALPAFIEGQACFDRRTNPLWAQIYLLYRVRTAFCTGQWDLLDTLVKEMQSFASETSEWHKVHFALATFAYGAFAREDKREISEALADLETLAAGGDPVIQAVMRTVRAELTRRNGDPLGAAGELREVLDVVDTGNIEPIAAGWEDRFTPLQVRALLVRALLDADETADARAVALTALEKAYATKAPPFVMSALLACARVEAARGEIGRAAEAAALIASAPCAFAADRLHAQALLDSLKLTPAPPGDPCVQAWLAAAAERLAAAG